MRPLYDRTSRLFIAVSTLYHDAPEPMLEGALYMVSSFWLGAMHAATPGHGKTVSAAYLVGTRGRPTDALALGVFVTLAHTSGIVIFGAIAALGSTVLSQRSEGYVSLATAVLMLLVGIWTLAGYWRRADASHRHFHADKSVHQHGWGPLHSHHITTTHGNRPSWGILLGLGVAGGLLPDPAALAVLLGALASGKLVLGLLTVLLFSLGFASVLVLVGTVVGHFGRIAVGWINGDGVQQLQFATACIIMLVGGAMTVGAWQQLSSLS